MLDGTDSRTDTVIEARPAICVHHRALALQARLADDRVDLFGGVGHIGCRQRTRL